MDSTSQIQSYHCSTSTVTVEESRSNVNVTNSTSHLSQDPFVEGIDNFLLQLKYKKSLEEEDASMGRYASVLCNPQVSQVITNLFGKDKSDLKPEMRELLQTLEVFFKEYIRLTKENNGSKIKEILMELLHNPGFIVFRQVLANDPMNWCTVVLPLLKEHLKKKALVEQLEEDINSLQQKRRELAKDTGLVRKKLEEAKNARAKITEKIHPDNVRRMKIALEQYKSEADKLEEESAKRGPSFVTNAHVSDLMSRFQDAKVRHQALKEDLAKISVNGALPADMNEASRVLQERKTYLEALVEQISEDPYNLSLKLSGSFN